jgi:hypothetical protein
VQEQILEKNPSANMKVYAVWFPMIPTDSRSRWSWTAGAIDDKRVVHIWDEKKVVGQWLAKQLNYNGKDSEVLWDAYLLYGPQAQWESTPSPLVSWGRTINDTRTEFEKSLSTLLPEKKN